MEAEVILDKVRNRMGTLNEQAEQILAEVMKVLRENDVTASSVESPSSPGKNVILEEYEAWDDEQRRKYQDEAETLYSDWISKKMSELNAMWLIVIDGDIVAHGQTLRTFPHDDDLDSLCDRYGKFPYIFISPSMLLVEETLWHSTETANRSGLRSQKDKGGIRRVVTF